jgi:hypothetical protein
MAGKRVAAKVNNGAQKFDRIVRRPCQPSGIKRSQALAGIWNGARQSLVDVVNGAITNASEAWKDAQLNRRRRISAAVQKKSHSGQA